MSSLRGQNDCTLGVVAAIKKAVADKDADALSVFVERGIITIERYNQLVEEFGDTLDTNKLIEKLLNKEKALFIKEEELRAKEEDISTRESKLGVEKMWLSRQKRLLKNELIRKIKGTIAGFIVVITIFCGWGSIVADYGKNVGFWSFFLLMWALHYAFSSDEQKDD